MDRAAALRGGVARRRVPEGLVGGLGELCVVVAHVTFDTPLCALTAYKSAMQTKTPPRFREGVCYQRVGLKPDLH